MYIRPLPLQADDLPLEMRAPPRLKAHLCLVHEVACKLTAQIAAAWPRLVIDEPAVHLGAAIHDIGKVIHPDELIESGEAHEYAWAKAATRTRLV